MIIKIQWINRLGRFCWLFVGGLIFCLLLNSLPFWFPETSVVAQSITSSQLVKQGIEQYQLGKFTQAITIWEQALSQPLSSENQAILHSNLAQAYRQVGKLDQSIAQWQQAIDIYKSKNDRTNRRLGAQLSAEQAQTYSDLGQHQRAITLLQSALEISRQTEDKTTEATAQGGIGNAYWALGDYDQAVTAYTASLEIAKAQHNSAYITTTLNNLGNVYVSRAERYIYQANIANLEGDDLENMRLTTQAKQDIKDAVISFHQSVEFSQSLGGLTEVRALLNLNRMLTRFQNDPNYRGIVDKTDLITNNRAQALSILATLPDSQDKAYALINLADTLKSENPAASIQTIELLTQAISISQKNDDSRSISFALGSLGQFYEASQQYLKAMELTRQAQFAAQKINAADSLYRWQWQAGRILKATGKTAEAIASYEQAIATLQSIRGDILAANKELQFNFRDSVEPVYRQLIGLLLSSENNNNIKSDTSKSITVTNNISKVVNILELLKLAELQNFFGDECVQLALNDIAKEQIVEKQNSTIELAKIKAVAGKSTEEKASINTSLNITDPKAAIIYSVILEDRTEMLLQLGDGSLKHYPVALNITQMQIEIDRLRGLLEKRSTDEYLQQSQKIYKALIMPMEADLALAKPSTLIFVQDSVLRKVPMAALHDGKEFLIQKYAIATTPSVNLTVPKVLDRRNLKALIVGLTVARPPFDPLPNVSEETTGVQKILGGKKLLDADFTVTHFEEVFKKQSYPIVHIATHGKFGVDNASTFLLGFDSKISIEEIDNLLRARGNRKAVELLTLSACQTAAGDNRSALGIAGVAVRAGVRSALATLWFINDESTVPLIEEFYTQLRNSNVTKAEALRQAQLKLIAKEDYNHPAVWSPFILIGNWL